MTHKSMEGLGAPELFNKPLAPHEFDAPDLDLPKEEFDAALRDEIKKLHTVATDGDYPHWQTAADNLWSAVQHLCDYDNLHGIEPRTEALYIPERNNDPHKGSPKLGAVALYDQPIKTPTQEMPYGHEPWMGKPWQVSPEHTVE